jgi:hypothetical protein
MKRFVVAGALTGLAMSLVAVAALFVAVPGSPGFYEVTILLAMLGTVFVLAGAAGGAVVGVFARFLGQDRRDGE